MSDTKIVGPGSPEAHLFRIHRVPFHRGFSNVLLGDLAAATMIVVGALAVLTILLLFAPAMCHPIGPIPFVAGPRGLPYGGHIVCFPEGPPFP